MSNKILYYEYQKNNDEKKLNHKLMILPKKLKINKIFTSRKTPKKKFFLNLQLNAQIENTNQNYFNKRSKKNNVISTSRNYLNLNIENYKNNINPSFSPSKDIIKKNCQKMLNSICNLNNSYNNNKPKVVVLPNIKSSKTTKKQLLQSKEKSTVFRRNLKEISLGDLLVNDDESQPPINKKNKNCHSNSEWNLFKDNDKEKNNEIHFEDLKFNNNYRKYTIINNEITNTNKSVDEKYKSGAERLKEIRKQKLIDCNKLIKQMAKETANKRNILNKYLLLMKQNFENSTEFNTKFN